MGVKQKRKQYPDMAKKLAKGIRPRDVLIEAGYSETQARKGWSAVPDGVKLLLPAKGKRLMNLGSVDPQTRRKLVRGRLVDNVIKGKDGGSMSAKILGSDSELNMWMPEMNQGLIILNAPSAAVANKAEILNAPEEE
ncbi:MAG TPA: hypothetical protein VK788_12475 [Terriglobales bacterium]|jgi:hypothetical protein|nr:hypothetical protein [Terriglobales bacterium]